MQQDHKTFRRLSPEARRKLRKLEAKGLLTLAGRRQLDEDRFLILWGRVEAEEGY